MTLHVNMSTHQLSQPLLALLTILQIFISSKGYNANPLHSAMLMVSSSYHGPHSSLDGNQPSYFAFRTHPLIRNQFLDVDFHPWKSNLMLIIVLLEQHYNNPKHTRQLCPHIGPKPHGGRGVQPWVGEATPPCRYKPL